MKTIDMQRYGTYLHPDVIKALKLYAIEHNMKDYEVFNLAIKSYLDKTK